MAAAIPAEIVPLLNVGDKTKMALLTTAPPPNSGPPEGLLGSLRDDIRTIFRDAVSLALKSAFAGVAIDEAVAQASKSGVPKIISAVEKTVGNAASSAGSATTGTFKTTTFK